MVDGQLPAGGAHMAGDGGGGGVVVKVEGKGGVSVSEGYRKGSGLPIGFRRGGFFPGITAFGCLSLAFLRYGRRDAVILLGSAALWGGAALRRAVRRQTAGAALRGGTFPLAASGKERNGHGQDHQKGDSAEKSSFHGDSSFHLGMGFLCTQL